MMQVAADWSFAGNKARCHEMLRGFVFRGTGWYLSKKDTILLVPIDPTETPWKEVWDEEAYFRVYVWNCAFEETIFGQLSVPPIRVDER